MDPFAYTADRKLDRDLLADYERTVEELLRVLDPGNHAVAVEIAVLPEAVRGFGHVRERHAGHARQRKAELLEKLRGTGDPARPGDGGAGQAHSRVVMAG